ncbi:MAG: T9SS type A sorting domain-containing protein [candidate division Zixibacteria bacterium]|nr:T9SS type A sorting domain-containing protein [candidate division Zixibacteria bacterium]
MFIKEYIKRIKLTGIYLAAIFFCGLITSPVLAQNPDTLKVFNAIGQPGDSVSVNIYLANHVDEIAGFLVVMNHNSSVLHTDSSRFTPAPVLDSLTFNSTVHGDTMRVLAADWFSRNPIPVGSRNIYEMKFLIDEGARNGDYWLHFISHDEDDVSYTSLSTPDSEILFPVLVDGYVTVNNGAPNALPVFDPPLSSPRQVDVGSNLQFNVTITDADNDFLNLSSPNLPENATFPPDDGFGLATSSFSFTPAANQQGNTYNVVFVASDGYVEVRDTVVIQVTGGGGGDDGPIIIAPGTRDIDEGGHLEFIVTATDPEGGYVTLSANNLPANASFTGAEGYSTVSDTFYFDPDYSQGGSTYNVTFVASDNSGNVSQSTTSIYVLDAINDFIEVATMQGALPGSLGRDFIVNLRNPLPVYGLQFDLLFDPEILEILDVEADSVRAFDFQLLDTLVEDGRYRVIILPTSLDTISSGTGKIVSLIVDVDDHAETGPSAVWFDSATTVQDSIGTTVDMMFEEGNFTVDILGDANLDAIVNVGDCIAVIANMIGQFQMNIRSHDAADYNRDGDVRIGDLQGILYHILGRPFGPPPPLNKKNGSIELVRDDILPGFQGDLPLWLDLNTKAGGVQFTIDYDPSEVIIHGLTAGNMTSDLVLDYNDTGEQIKAAIYDFGLVEFGPVVGELVTLDVEFLDFEVDPSTALRLTDFEIVTVDAYRLNIEVLGELPDDYRLHQNYPNPFNSKTLISFEMPYSSSVKLDVYNVLGQKVNELYAGHLDAGSHQLTWNGTNSYGIDVTSGVYFYRLQAESFDKTMKMLLVK